MSIDKGSIGKEPNSLNKVQSSELQSIYEGADGAIAIDDQLTRSKCEVRSETKLDAHRSRIQN
jgi:hypothetical protein